MMVEKFEYKGKWWLPENPENKLHGTLVFTPRPVVHRGHGQGRQRSSVPIFR